VARIDRVQITDIQPLDTDVRKFRCKLFERCCFLRLPGTGDYSPAFFCILLGEFEADAAIGAGYEHGWRF
jgi:hypothetical protein